jgi:hypothetical protein
VVEFISDGKNFFESGMQEIGILWKILANQAVGVFVRAALPGGVRMGKVESCF